MNLTYQSKWLLTKKCTISPMHLNDTKVEQTHNSIKTESLAKESNSECSELKGVINIHNSIKTVQFSLWINFMCKLWSSQQGSQYIRKASLSFLYTKRRMTIYCIYAFLYNLHNPCQIQWCPNFHSTSKVMKFLAANPTNIWLLPVPVTWIIPGGMGLLHLSNGEKFNDENVGWVGWVPGAVCSKTLYSETDKIGLCSNCETLPSKLPMSNVSVESIRVKSARKLSKIFIEYRICTEYA